MATRLAPSARLEEAIEGLLARGSETGTSWPRLVGWERGWYSSGLWRRRWPSS